MSDVIRFRRDISQARPFEIEALAVLKQIYGPDGYYLPEDYGKAKVSSQWLNTEEEGSINSLAVLFRLRSSRVFEGEPGDPPLDPEPFWAEAMIRDQAGDWMLLQDFMANAPLYRIRGEMLQGWYSIGTNVNVDMELNYNIRYVNSGCFYAILEECTETRARSVSKIKRFHRRKNGLVKRVTPDLSDTAQ